MKKSTILAAICMTLISLGALAQPGGGGMSGGQRGGMSGGQRGGGQGMPQQQQQPRSIFLNFTGAVGYFFIDADEALQKIKIKKDPAKVEAVGAVIAKFNSTHQSVVEAYRIDVDNLEFARENLEAANRDMTIIREIMNSVGESSRKLKPIMTEAHLLLSDEITPLLNEKELKRWTKYYEDLCDDNSFDPNAPEHGEEGGPRDGEGPRGERGEGEEGRMPPRE